MMEDVSMLMHIMITAPEDSTTSRDSTGGDCGNWSESGAPTAEGDARRRRRVVIMISMIVLATMNMT